MAEPNAALMAQLVGYSEWNIALIIVSSDNKALFDDELAANTTYRLHAVNIRDPYTQFMTGTYRSLRSCVSEMVIMLDASIGKRYGTGKASIRFSGVARAYSSIGGSPYIFVSPNGLDYHLNSLANYYEDTGATTPAVDESDLVASWKSTAGVALEQSASSNRPILNLGVAKFNNQPALLFVDDQTTPTSFKGLDKTSALTTAMNTSVYSFAQVARLDGLTAFGFVWSPGSGALGMRMRDGSNTRYVLGNSYPTAQIETLDDDQGVHSACWDGTYYTCGWNNHEVGFMPDDPAVALFTNGATLRVGNYALNANDSSRWIGKFCRPQAGALTIAQRRSERVELGLDMGLPNSGKGKKLFLVNSNSIGAGYSTYTNPWPTQLAALRNSSIYRVVNKSAVSAQTPARAAAGHDEGGIRLLGNCYGSKLFKVTAVTDRENFTAANSYNSASPSWTTNTWTTYGLIFESGNNKGYCQTVLSNGSDTIVLDSPGLPVAPAVNDTFRIYKPGEQLAEICGVFHEMRNNLWTVGSTEGPAATGGTKAACLVYQRHVCAVRAMKFYGVKMIGLVMLPDSGSNYANYQADVTTIQAWMEEDSENLFDAWVGLDEMPEMVDPGNTTYYIDGLHPSNTGGGVIAAAVNVAASILGW